MHGRNPWENAQRKDRAIERTQNGSVEKCTEATLKKRTEKTTAKERTETAPAKKRTRKVHGDETMDVSAAKEYTGKPRQELEHGNRRRKKTRVTRRCLENHGRCLRERLHGKSLAKDLAEEASQKGARKKGPAQWHTAKTPTIELTKKATAKRHTDNAPRKCPWKSPMLTSAHNMPPGKAL